jgi:acetyltransferase
LGAENLNSFFNPKKIAVIGASNRDDSAGGKILRNLLGSYKGSVFPVNPFHLEIQGIAAYPSICRVPERIDLAIIATPSHTIPQIVEECGKAKVQSIIIVSADLSRCDEDGEELVRQILEHKKSYGLRIIGPNSLGIIRPKINLYATLTEKKAIPGKIAFISQSAALCGAILEWSVENQVGLSGVVSTGSSIDVDLADLINYFGTDPQTRSIALYVESIKNIRSFMSAARGFARSKPIIIVKAGRSRQNSSPKLLCTNPIISKDILYDAAFRRVGVVRVESVNELLECAKALSTQPSPSDNDLTIITNARGLGLLAVDQMFSRGGKLSKISDVVAENLKSILPHSCSISNPIDVSEEAPPESFAKVIQVCLNDSSVNNILVMYAQLSASNSLIIANNVIELVAKTRKRLLVCLMGEGDSQEARRMLNKNGIPAFKTPEEAINTFMHLYEYTQNLKLLYQTPEEVPLGVGNPITLKATIRRAFCEGRKSLNLVESLCFLEAYGIPTIKTRAAFTVEDATLIASEFGYPIIMKPLFHLNRPSSDGKELAPEVCAPSEIPANFNLIAKNTNNTNIPVDFQGIAIQQKNQENGYSLFVGSRKDTQFGAAILFGPAGIGPDFVKEISVGFPPLNQVLARQIVESNKDIQFAQAIRNSYALSTELLEQVLVKFSQMITDFPEIFEVDVNPLIARGNKATAADARIIIDRERIIREFADYHEHMIIAPYPRKYIAKRTLKNGAQVKLRPIKPEDEVSFNELFKSLSEESIRFRFFEIIKEMSHDTLTRYCNLDYDREIAIVAELQNERRIIGAVRLVLDADGKNGEFAIMVGDSWQGLGLGSKLMDHIMDVAGDLKLETIYSYVIRSNTKMIDMCTKKGFEIKSIDEYNINIFKRMPI